MPNTDRIKFTTTDGIVTVKVGDFVLASSANAIALSENGYPSRHYFPRTDVTMSALTPTDTSTHCPFKGQASYFSVATPDGELADIAWTYANAIADVSEIAGLIAFYEEKLSVTVCH